jgi:hypothetical protein
MDSGSAPSAHPGMTENYSNTRASSQTHPRIPAAQFARALPLDRPSENRGRRECRALDAPAASYAKQKAYELVTTVTPENARHSPRNGFNGFLRALLGDRAFLPPSPAQCASIVANLISASRYQDHTTSPSALAQIVLLRHPRPPHPAPNVRDDREAPLLIRHRTREEEPLICPSAQAHIFV